MELKLKYQDKNIYPLGGILIKGTSPSYWIAQIQQMSLALEQIKVYPLPDTKANTIWGCLVVFSSSDKHIDLGRNNYCQVVNHLLFIPEKSYLFPSVTDLEIEKLLAGQNHLLHPELGLIALTETVDWQSLIVAPLKQDVLITEPAPAVFIPMQVHSFQVKPVPPEEVLKNFEEKAFPTKQKLEDKPLNIFEKAKLALYKQIFSKKNPKEGPSNQEEAPKPLHSFLNFFKNLLTPKNGQWMKNMEEDYEALEKRNQKAIERLLEMLKNDPNEALKYAIPLDENGTVRGGQVFKIDLSKKWFDFSLFNNNSGSLGNHRNGGSGGVMPHDQYQQLQNQYHKTAEELIKQQEYHKAAFVYMKLLKNYHLAAQTLENGKHYQEAASLYLKYANNKPKAAECYEKGNMTMEAIDIYKELNQDEKVGDLYLSIHKQKEAYVHYEKVVDNYKLTGQYVKASLLYRNKMENETGAQDLLREGWRSQKDAFNCLNNYFNNISDPKIMGKELESVYSTETHDQNRETFLQVLKYEYHKENEHAERIKEIAYEIIVKQIEKNPNIVTELREFNKNDTQLVKDTVRFKLNPKGSSNT